MTHEATPRTRIRRLPEKGVDDVAALHAILDAGRVAHVAFTDGSGRPVNIPTASARDGDRLLLHGSTGSRLLRRLTDGAEVCATVTLLDGMVLARSAFESSMHYRSAMVFGTATEVPSSDKVAALRAMSEAWLPGRWDTLRPPTAKELAATTVLALPLDEWSVKVSDGPPEDAPEDLDAPVWAGVLPILTSYGDPVPAPDLRGDHAPWRPRDVGVDPTGADLKKFLAEADAGEVVMLNLLRFAEGGADSYRAYAEAIAPFLEKVGAEVVYVGRLGTAMVAPRAHDWDAVLLVRYPDRAAFSRMVADPAYQEITHLRTEALTAAVLQPTTPGLD